MKLKCQGALIAVWLICLGGITFVASAQAAAQPDDTPAALKLNAVTDTWMEGKRSFWALSIDPQGQQLLDVQVGLPLRFGTWLVGGGQPITLPVITQTTTVMVPAVPLLAGELLPLVQVSFGSGERRFETMVISESTVHVEALKEPLQWEMTLPVAIPSESSKFAVTLLLRNTSPFTVTGISLRGTASDLEWKVGNLLELPPYATATSPITLTVRGGHPQVSWLLVYRWNDDAGQSHDRAQLVAGPTLRIEAWPSWLAPFAPYAGTVIGAILGVTGSLVTFYFTERRKERQQQQKDRNHVRGLLELSITQALEAADRAQPVRLESLESVYLSDRALYAIAQRMGVHDEVKALYEAAVGYNAGLDSPLAAASRKERLKEAAEALRKALHSGFFE